MMKLIVIISLLLLSTNQALAYNIWFVTNQNKILVVKDVDGAIPIQQLHVTHAPVSDAWSHDFGDIGFAKDGMMYGISMTYGSPSMLYSIDLDSGNISKMPDSLPFEWGNALCFDIQAGIGYIGGGLEDSSPYTYLKYFRSFQDSLPATSNIWYDMSIDYPNGGSAGDFAISDRYIYAIWLVPSGFAYEYHLLEFAKDGTSYTDLGRADLDIADPNGIWGLASDGRTLYANSPTALYRVDIVNHAASYSKIFDFALGINEKVNGATSKRTDLSITHTASSMLTECNATITLVTTLIDNGSYDTSLVSVEISLPTEYDHISSSADKGSYNQTSGEWSIGDISSGERVSLSIDVKTCSSNTLVSSAEIIASDVSDYDSDPHSSFGVDDLNDSMSDDDEAMTSVDIYPSIGGYFWIDDDYDGIIDSNEQKVSGITVRLLNSDKTPTVDMHGNSTALTDSNGKYHFSVTPNHTYRVQFDISNSYLKDGYIFTKTHKGSGISSSNIDADGITQPINSTLLDEHSRYDAGVVCWCSSAVIKSNNSPALSLWSILMMIVTITLLARAKIVSRC